MQPNRLRTRQCRRVQDKQITVLDIPVKDKEALTEMCRAGTPTLPGTEMAPPA
jgi:hypothetical protein